MDLPIARGQQYLDYYGFVSNVAIPQPHPEEVPPTAELEEVVAFHKTFRDEVVRSGLGDRYDNLWGRYLPEERWSTTHFSLPMLTNSLFGRRDRVWMFARAPVQPPFLHHADVCQSKRGSGQTDHHLPRQRGLRLTTRA